MLHYSVDLTVTSGHQKLLARWIHSDSEGEQLRAYVDMMSLPKCVHGELYKVWYGSS